MHRRDAGNDGQPDAGSFLRRGKTLEYLENAQVRLLGNAFAVVRHAEPVILRRLAPKNADHRIGSASAIFDRIGDEILKNLPQPGGIGLDDGKIRRDVHPYSSGR